MHARARERKPISVRARAKWSFIHELARHSVLLPTIVLLLLPPPPSPGCYDTAIRHHHFCARHPRRGRVGVGYVLHRKPGTTTAAILHPRGTPSRAFLAFLPEEFRILLSPDPDPLLDVRSTLPTLTLKPPPPPRPQQPHKLIARKFRAARSHGSSEGRTLQEGGTVCGADF